MSSTLKSFPWNQPILNNEVKGSCSMKQQELLMEFKLIPGRHPTFTRQRRKPLLYKNTLRNCSDLSTYIVIYLIVVVIDALYLFITQ